ncbi:hypothetical protein BOTBODRAFT_138946 [Botryobasidium botryosum FD-172 SS1]|uniref:deoxyhypusine synthase n=1 Tax=Botryobasidium botryosum (strain FD-172 SS1) TaxID=930990 RepID=A0A067M1B2_BOTB1|nr:hypothetical protein BOTBODRAFT_138946 [Botryobasidium botryosum FD-172 SS1]
MPSDVPSVKGPDFSEPLGLQEFLDSYLRIGFQATNLGRAMDVVNKMLAWRLSDEPVAEEEAPEYRDPAVRASTRVNIFLGYTSNLITSGIRESILHLIKTRRVHALVTTAGGVEEDFIKCLAPTYVGDFAMDGAALHSKGHNRTGNLILPNKNYAAFQDWMLPILDTMHDEQEQQGKVWTPSRIINRLGKEINNEESVYYWCYKNNIPVFSPAITDGALGEMIYFHTHKRPGFIVDIAADMFAIETLSVTSKKAAMLTLGGGVSKHHIANAMYMRGGADFAVYINTAQEFDGCDSGARPDEAVSWGKIRPGAVDVVKVHADATIVFPLLVAATFARHHWEEKKNKNNKNEESSA